MLSYDRNPSFTGRSNSLDRMQRFLESQNKKELPVPLIIHGTGGIGKTQLVREYVFAHCTEFSSVAWIDSRNVQNVRSGLANFMQRIFDCYVKKANVTPPPYLKIARHLGITGPIDHNGRLATLSSELDQLVTACLQWLDREGNTGWLLIFDNVDDLESFHVSNYFPKKTQGRIIITSRRPECSRLGEGQRLEVMELQESISLLSKSYGRSIKEDDSEYDEAKRIVEKLGCLPLAIDQAGSYLSMLQKPLHAFLTLFEENFNKTLSKKPPAAVWQYGEETVVTTWEISFKEIEERDPLAADLLLRCSYLANNDISADFICRALPAVYPTINDLDENLSTLFSFSLATRKLENSFSIHPIVHWWARERLDAEEAEDMAAAAIRMISCAIWSFQSRDISSDRHIMQHMQVSESLCAKRIDRGRRYRLEDFRLDWCCFADMYRYHGRNKEGEEMYKRALMAYEKTFGPNHPDTLALLQDMARVYYNRGQMDEAERIWKRVSSGYDKISDSSPERRLMVLQNLALLAHGRGEVDEAEKIWRQGLEGYEKVFGPDHPQTLGVVQNLGMLQTARGHMEEAELLLERALKGIEAVFGTDHPDTLRIMLNLGILYIGRGQNDEAEDIWKKTLAGYQRILEPDHPDTLHVVQNLASLYYRCGQGDKAEKMWKQALAGYENVLEPDHSQRLLVIQNLATLYRARGKIDVAENMWKQALGGYERTSDVDHQYALMVVVDLATIYYTRGDAANAEKMWKCALTGYEKLLVPYHPVLSLVRFNLGVFNASQAHYAKAERYFKEALTGYCLFSKGHEADIYDTHFVLGNLYEDMDDRQEDAETAFAEAQAGFEKLFGPEDDRAANARTRLEALKEKLGNASG